MAVINNRLSSITEKSILYLEYPKIVASHFTKEGLMIRKTLNGKEFLI